MLSPRVGVEYKTTQDFVDSLLDGRLLLQLRQLRLNYQRPLLIIEGEEDIFSQRAVHPNSIRGMLSTITISYGIPIITTKTPKETAALMTVMAGREQDETAKNFNPHTEKKALSVKDQQEYVVSSLPGIGQGLAKPLLRQFRTVRKVLNAPTEELKKVEKIGEKKAQEIQKVLDGEYEPI